SDKPLTGRAIADNVRKLVGGSVLVSFGDSNFIKTARDALGIGSTIDMKGVSGPLDYDEDGNIEADIIGFDFFEDMDNTFDFLPARVWPLALIDPETGDGTWCCLGDGCGSANDCGIPPIGN